GLNNAHQAIGQYGTNGVLGGQAFTYDTATATFSNFPNPPASPGKVVTIVALFANNDAGQIAGLFQEQLTVCPPHPASCDEAVRSLLATPLPAPAPRPPPPLKPQKHRKPKAKRSQWLPRMQDVREWQHQGGFCEGQWQMVRDEQGQVCLTDGGQVMPVD